MVHGSWMMDFAVAVRLLFTRCVTLIRITTHPIIGQQQAGKLASMRGNARPVMTLSLLRGLRSRSMFILRSRFSRCAIISRQGMPMRSQAQV